MKKSVVTTLLLFFCILTNSFAGPKLVKIRLTGTLHEDVEMTVGRNGRTEIISMLPYEFRVEKNLLPITLTFVSDNYDYTPIVIPRSPVDEIGHVYLLKVEERNVHQDRQIQNDERRTQQPKVVGIDTTHGVNAAPFTGDKNPNTFAVIIANEEYEMATNVEMATNDGLAVKNYLSKTYGLTDKQILYYPNATFGKMNKAIRDLSSIAKAYDGKINLLFYYAGHGIPDNATKDAYLMPTDADGADPSVCYSLKKLYAEIDEMHLNQSVVLLDACFSGAQRDGDMIIAARGVAIKPNEEKPKGNTIVISATSDEETAFSYKDEKHGLFTYFLLKHMQEKKGKVTIGSLSKYIAENVSKQSVLINGKKQTPTISIPSTLTDWEDMKLLGK